MTSLSILYFGIGGRGEAVRIAAYLGGLAFEDRFTSFPEHSAAKAEGKRRWAGIPEMTLFDADGKELQVISQSNACLRYIGSITGLYPENFVQRALVDEALDSVEDTLSFMISKVTGAKDDDEKKANVAELVDEKGFMMYMFGKFEKRLEENEKRGNKNGFLVGDSLTIADLKLGMLANNALNDLPNGKEVLAKFARLLKLVDIINGMDKVKAFREQFAKNVAESKEKKTNVFKFEGKFVPASFK